MELRSDYRLRAANYVQSGIGPRLRLPHISYRDIAIALHTAAGQFTVI